MSKKKNKLKKPNHKPVRIGGHGFRDNYGNIHYADELIFPIIYHNEKTEKFYARGTGYFIHPAGGFITAKHVLFDNGKLLKPCFGIQSFKGGEHLLREIVAFFPHDSADIGVGMLKGHLMKNAQPHFVASFPISLSKPQIGDKIRTYAFPKSEVQVEYGKQLGIFKGTWSTGKIRQLIRAGEHHLLKTDVYETSMHIEGGASGGPVLRGTSVIGVNSTGWEFGEGFEPSSCITPIHEILDLEVSDSNDKKSTLRQLIHEGFVAAVE